MAPLPKTVNVQAGYFQHDRVLNPQGMAPSSPGYGQLWPRGTGNKS